jgi:hypothetical protein
MRKYGTSKTICQESKEYFQFDFYKIHILGACMKELNKVFVLSACHKMFLIDADFWFLILKSSNDRRNQSIKLLK